MSSYNNPPQYNVDPPQQPPQQPQYQPQQPYAQPQVHVEPGVGQPGGGQPPYYPPGGYTPVPPPPPRKRRGGVVIATILSVALLIGAGAFVFFQYVWTSGPDPAERFPASAGMYVELNLDPSFDQTPKLLEQLSKFEGFDYDDTDDLWADLIEDSGLEGVEAERDLTSWLGRRHGFAMWEHAGAPYGVANLASTDAGAAEDGLDRIREASGATEDNWAFEVTDDSVLMVFGEEGAADALEAAESEAGSSPLSESGSYDEARSWLDGDQLLVYWFDVDAVADMAEAMGEDEEFAEISDMFSGHLITGLSAFDEGFELSYRFFDAEEHPWTGSEDLMDNMGELPAADLAVSADVPENLDEITEEWASEFEDSFGGSGDDMDFETDAGSPLTEEEYAEYLELEQQWFDGEISEEDEERYWELDDRYWMHGTEDDPVETYEEESYGNDFDDVFGQAEELIDLLSGAQLSFGLDFDAESGVDPESLFLSALLSEDRAAELNDMLDELSDGEELPDGIEADGSELSYTGSQVADGTLSDDSRFSDFADKSPGRTALGVWVDLGEIHTFGDELQQLEPLSAFAWSHGTEDGDGTGLARLYLK